MHEGQLEIDTALVRRLLSSQFPSLARLPLIRFRSVGSVNGLFRLGDDLYVRLPLVEWWADDVLVVPKLRPWLRYSVYAATLYLIMLFGNFGGSDFIYFQF